MNLAPRFYICSWECPTHDIPMRSIIILSTSKQAYKVAGHIWGVRGKRTHGAAYAVHRLPRPSPSLADKNPFREWNMWETGLPRGIILNYVCPHLSGRRFHLVALCPFVNLARDSGTSPFFYHSSDSFPTRSSVLNAARCIALSIHDPLWLDSSLETALNSRGRIGIETMINMNIFDASHIPHAFVIKWSFSEIRLIIY